MIGAKTSRGRTAEVRTSTGSAKIAPSRLWVDRSAASAVMAVTVSAKADSVILRDMAKTPD
jgi:hypothetical protein